MRQLDKFDDESTARTVADVLLAEGIEATVDPARDGSVRLWVHDEGRLNEASQIAADYLADPQAERFRGARDKAAERRKQQQAEVRAVKARTVDVRRKLSSSSRYGPVTLVLIIACVVVAFLTTTPSGIARLDLGDRVETLSLLTFQSYVQEGGYYRWQVGLPDLMSGELWRLFTPILLHFGLLHILFNMWWLRDLGTLIERRQSSIFFAVMVLALAGVSNTAQYLLRQSPVFGGMSGVVYGLFGYIWIRGRFDPASGYGIDKTVIYWMVGFYVLCWTGLLGPVANVAHTAGLLLGGAWGWLAGGGLRRLRG